MKKKSTIITFLILTFCLLLSFHVGAADMITLPVTAEEDYVMARDFVDYMNEKREAAGIEPLVMDPGWTDVAMLRADELVIFMAHIRPKYMTEGGSLNHAIEYRHASYEDIAAGQGTVADVYADWYGSAGHRPALIDPDDKYCGVGTIIYNNTRYWVLITAEEPVESTFTIPSTIVERTRNIEVEINSVTFAFKRYDPTIYYGDNSDTEPIRLFNKTHDSVCQGYKMDGSLLTYDCHNPEIFTVDTATGYVKPKGVGTGTMTVALKSHPEMKSEVTVTVRPQSGTLNDTDGKVYEFNTTMDGVKVANSTIAGSIAVNSGLSYPCTGKEITPTVTCTDWYETEMVEGKDFYVTYKNNVSPGVAYAYVYPVTGGNYDPGDGYAIKRISFTITGSMPETEDTTPETEPTTTPSTTPSTEPTTTPSTEPATKPSTTPSTEPTTTPSTEPATKPSTTPSTKPSTSTPVVKPTTPSTEAAKPNTNTTVTKPTSLQLPKTVSGKNYTITIAKTKVTGNGKSQKPKITVKYKGKKLKTKYYTVKYSNNKYTGLATVTVKGKRSYKSKIPSTKIQFVITPKKMKTPSAKAGKGYVKASWKTEKKVSGYVVQISTNKKFKSGVQEFVMKSGQKSKTVKDLARKKTYYVRTRAFKTIQGTTFYGSWSKTKKIKTK